jgi:peptidoglycan/LPS O-acetylase OafA/YrhL
MIGMSTRRFGPEGRGSGARIHRRVKSHRLGVIDGLRGIAILVVLWFHTWQQSWLGADFSGSGLPLNFQPIVETGFLGVSLFFFISGFVIGLPFIEANVRGSPPPRLVDFYWRRFLKIVPSYWLNIAVSVALGLTVYETFGAALNDVVLHVFFIHNLWFLSRMTLNGVLWTLAVEVQFYLIAPFLMRVFLRFPLVTFLIVVCAANMWRFLLYTPDSLLLDYRMEQLPGNIDLFMIGILAAYVFVHVSERRADLVALPWRWTILAAAGTVCALWLVNDCYSVRFHDPSDSFSAWQMRYRTFLGASFAMIACGSLFAVRWWKAALANPVLLFFAAISYNLYLWHDVVLLMSERLHFPNWVTPVKSDDHLWQWEFMIGAPLVAIAIATAITYWFERPILRFKSVDPVTLFDSIVHPPKKGGEPKAG